MPTVTGSAALAGSPTVIVTAATAVNPQLLWQNYLAAAVLAASAWHTWRMMRSAAGASGQTGFLFQAAYEADRAADLAYTTWQTAFKSVNPGVTG